MPDEDRDQDRDEDDDDDADGSRPAPTTVVDYNRAISHTSHCSFRSSARFIPRVQASVPGGGEASAMWVWSGIILSGLLALTALWRRRSAGTYYERDVYGMTGTSHARYALVFSAFTALFAAAPFLHGFPLIPALAILALTALIYGTSFLRGASGEDE